MQVHVRKSGEIPEHDRIHKPELFAILGIFLHIYPLCGHCKITVITKNRCREAVPEISVAFGPKT